MIAFLRSLIIKFKESMDEQNEPIQEDSVEETTPATQDVSVADAPPTLRVGG